MFPSFLAAAAGLAHPLWPFAVLLICLVAIVVMVSVLRVHAFFALVAAAILAGALSERLPGEYGTHPTPPAREQSHLTQAAHRSAQEFGKIAGKIGIVIALAAVIGTCLVESGGAEKVVRRFFPVFGREDAG